MKFGRTQMIFVPGNGAGRIHTFRANLNFIKAFFLVLLLCVCAVPLLEMGLLSLVEKVDQLEKKKSSLETEISRLQYVKRSLNRLEEKEVRLRDFFGMAEYRSLEEIIGVGGHSVVVKSEPEQKERDEVTSSGDVFIGSREKAHQFLLHEKIENLASNYDILHDLVAKQNVTWASTPSIVPVDHDAPKVSSKFGWRKNPFTHRREFHSGIDIIGPEGTMIISPSSGIVLTRGYDRWLGNFLVLDHGSGIKTIYGHLETISVIKGTRVDRGTPLGVMGNTGLSTSRHLHYVVLLNDRAVDPMQYILDVRG